MIADKEHSGRALSCCAEFLWDVGRGEEAIATYRRGMDADPSDWTIASGYLFTLQFCSEDPQLILAEHREWDRKYAAPLLTEIRPSDHDRTAARRLRIGYVSPWFCNHCQALFTIPLLSHHEHEGFEIYCYSMTRSPDAVTSELR